MTEFILVVKNIAVMSDVPFVTAIAQRSMVMMDYTLCKNMV